MLTAKQTATDKTKVEIVNNIICTMFSLYTAEQYTVEPVKVIYPDGRTEVTPDLSPRKTTASVDYINRCTGLSLSAEECVKLLKRMGHEAKASPTTADVIEVEVPATRPDVLHECDLMEDAAVAYGFDNLPRRFPSTNTVANPLPINKLSDIVRKEIAYAGWVEGLSLILCSHDENYAWLNQKDNGKEAILLENPKSLEYQLVRTSLLPGLLKTLRENRKHSLPLRLFEVSDVGHKDDSERERLSRNERRVCATYTDKEARFEVVHGLLDRIMKVLNVPFIGRNNAGKERGYWIEECNDETFLPGRAAVIKYRAGKSHAAVGLATSGPPAEPTLDSAVVSEVDQKSTLPTTDTDTSSGSSSSISQTMSHLTRKVAQSLSLKSQLHL